MRGGGILRGARVLARVQGIVHRDIKPENILLSPQPQQDGPSGSSGGGGSGGGAGYGVVKLADFGLSININLERAVTRAGTLDYMAPEVLVSRCRASAPPQACITLTCAPPPPQTAPKGICLMQPAM